MKFHPKFWICCMLASGLFCWTSANFAGPRGKDVQFGFNPRSHEFLKIKKQKKRERSLSEKYLGSNNIPPVSIYRKTTLLDGMLSDMPPQFSTASGPTLREFLQQLEMEKTELTEAMAENENEFEDSETTDLKDGSAESETANLSEISQLENQMTGNRPVMDEEERERFFQTTDPRDEGEAIFPRPDRFGNSVDRFFMYFPLETEAPNVAEPGRIMLPIDSKAIFQPPGNKNMRSSASLREGT